jgi:hypothetical protein
VPGVPKAYVNNQKRIVPDRIAHPFSIDYVAFSASRRPMNHSGF